MVAPERFSNLPAYAFPRLRELLDTHEPGGEVLHLSLGEPKHAFPAFVKDVIADAAVGFGKYPPNAGSAGLLRAQADWIARRYGVELDPETQTLAANGTREALYNAALALCPDRKNGERPVVLIPNPFYQVYMMGALTVGAEPVFVQANQETGFLPDFASVDEDILKRTAVAFLCSPSNPQGVVADRQYWSNLIALAEEHDFQIFADECYAEIYRDTPPPGALEVAAEVGADPERVLAFHSLSKRSNLPGLRAGFVAGGKKSIAAMSQLRNYAGSPIPLPLQAAAEKVWDEETHVEVNRSLYRAKYDLADEIFGNLTGYRAPEAGFFLWLDVGDGEAAALRLWKETGVRVLPGSYLAQTVDGVNPGHKYIRVAMVAPYAELERGLKEIRATLYEQG